MYAFDDRTPGPTLPERRSWGRAVQRGNSFIIVGGSSNGGGGSPYVESILRYGPDSNSWETLPQVLPDSDIVDVALFAPRDFAVDCS